MSNNRIVGVIFSFFVGTIFGSFFMLVGQRIPKNESIVRPRSHCSICGHVLNIWELIPVISYIFLRGKCGRCQVKLSSFYIFFEIISGLLFALTISISYTQKEIIIALTFLSCVLILSVSDIFYQAHPNKIITPFFVLITIERICRPKYSFWNVFVGFILAACLWHVLFRNPQHIRNQYNSLLAILGLVLGGQGVILALNITYICFIIFKKIGWNSIPTGTLLCGVGYMLYLIQLILPKFSVC